MPRRPGRAARLPGPRRVASRGDVGDDGGDVVAPAGGERELDQARRAVGAIGDAQRRRDRRVVDHVGQAVGAQQQPIAGPGVEARQGGLVIGLAVEGGEDERALRMVARLLGRELARCRS